MRTSEAPLTTPGAEINPGTPLTYPTTRTTLTMESTGATSSTAARALRMQTCAISFACSGVTAPPTLPINGIFPSTSGSWPAVNTKLPVRTAGTYAATGSAATGRVRLSSASFARTSIYATVLFM